MASASEPSVIQVEYQGRVAIITIDNDRKLNALTQMQYYDLAQTLRQVAEHEEVYVTVIVGKGRYFSAGADVSLARGSPSDLGAEAHKHWLTTFVAFNLNITHAFATHPKVLVIGLNGPVIGLTAALTGFADFIYCTPQAFLLTPFSSLGLVAEGGASRALISRLGPARGNEALIMSKRISADELEKCGYANAILDVEKGQHAKFRELLLKEVDERLGEHLIGESLTGIKKLIRKPDLEKMNNQNVSEVFAGLERFMKGVPQGEFSKIASGAKRHKL